MADMDPEQSGRRRGEPLPPPAFEPPPPPFEAPSPPPPGPAAWSWPEAAGPPETLTYGPSRRGRGLIAGILAALVLLAAGVGIGWGVARRSPSLSVGGDRIPIQSLPNGNPSGGRLSVKAIAAKVDPAVVDINTVIGSLFEGPPRGQAAGTGIILTSSGQVMTNNHVVEGASTIRVSIEGRSGSVEADVIGADPVDDVALLQLRGVSGLPTVSLADSSSIEIGQGVVAIGNALGRGGTPAVTQGVISALHQSIAVSDGVRTVGHLKDLIQTNAPIRPGDSGGPLVNSAGRVIGIITAGSRGAADGGEPASRVGYAIPVNAALQIVNQIRAGDESANVIIGQAGYVGIEVRELTSAAADRLGLGVDSGVLVVSVVPDSPAADAGLTGNSVITAINGDHVGSTDELGPAIHRHGPGESIRVTWVDGSGTHTASVRLISGPAV
jgi:S1-C subfamily serine protease